MNYDTMSFRELVQETINHSCHDLLMPPDDWLDMMRRAVIREASVGTCHIGMGYHLTLDKPSTPDGDYDLIPHKETP